MVKTIVIHENRNYLKKAGIIMLMVVVVYILIQFARYPSQHTYFLLPTIESVIIFSIAGLLPSCLVIILLVKSIFRKEAFLRIDNEGIFNGFFLYDKKFIKWEEIRGIETIKYNYTKYIAVYLKETPNHEKGLSFLFFKANEVSMGTPYIINSGDLDCSFSDLEKIVLDSYNQFVSS